MGAGGFSHNGSSSAQLIECKMRNGMQQWTRSFTPRQYRLFGGIISGAVRAATAGTDDSGSNEDATHAAARGRANRADGWLSRMRPEYERAWRQMYTFEPTPKPATKRDGQHKDDDNGDLGAGEAEQDDGMGLRAATIDELRATEATRSQKRPRRDGGETQERQAAAADDAAQTTSVANVTDADTTVANLPGDIGPAQSQEHHPQQHEPEHAVTPAGVMEQQEMDHDAAATEDAEPAAAAPRKRKRNRGRKSMLNSRCRKRAKKRALAAEQSAT